MRRFRNPRYAPEFLERKLNPSTVAPTTADVSTVDSTGGYASISTTYTDTQVVWDASTAPCFDPTTDVTPLQITLTSNEDSGDPSPDSPAPPDDPSGPGYYSYSYV